MKGKDFLMNVSNVDDDLIEEAEVSMNKNKKAWWGWLAAAACICLIAGGIVALSLNRNGVAYAKEMETRPMFWGVPMSKVDFVSDFSKYAADKKIRVMLMVYGTENGYPEIYNQKFDGKTYDELSDEYFAYVEKNQNNHDEITLRWNSLNSKLQKIIDEISGAELEWLKSIGAEDIEKQSYDLFVFTIRKEALEKIKNGKCLYRVIMASKNCDASSAEINPEKLIGEYECESMVFCSPLSSIGMWTDAKRSWKLVIGSNFISFDDGLSEDDVRFEKEMQKDNAENYFGFEPLDLRYMSDDLLGLFANEHFIVNVIRNSNNVRIARIFGGDGYVYLDRGLRGIFRLKAVK